MRSYPAGWPDPEDPDQVEPTLYLFMEGASWPAAHDGLPAGCLVVGTYSIARNLRGSLLPGAIRRASGFSVGTADADVAQPTDKLIAPWLSGTEKVVPAGAAELIASYDGPTGATAFSLGTFQVDPVSGKLSDPSLAVTLVETLVRMRQRESMPPYVGRFEFRADEPVDAAWVVDTVARSCGFFATPPAPDDAIISMPLQGGFPAEAFRAGPYANSFVPDGVVESGGDSGWQMALGAIAPVGPFTVSSPSDETKPVAAGQTYYMSLSFTGTVTFKFVSPEFELRPGGVFAVSDGVGGWNTQSYIPGLNTDWPDRVEVEISFPGPDPSDTRVRVRSDPAAAWSSPVVGETTPNTDFFTIACASGSTFNGFYAYTVAGAPWPASNASIHLLDRSLLAVDFEGGIDALTAIQQVVAGALGGQWFGGDGRLIVRPRAWLRGDTATVDTVEVKTKFADVAWTIDPNDVADRVELTYTPPAIELLVGTIPGLTIWSADEIYSIPAHGTLTFEIYPDLTAHSGGYTSTNQIGVDVDVAADSTGTPVGGGGGMNFVVERLPFGRIRVSLISAYSVPVYLVDSSGSVSLKLYTPSVARFDPALTISKGVEDYEAVTPLKVNLGKWCQTEPEANEALEIIYAGTRTPNWRVQSVDVLPDMRRELGDIVRLQFADVDLNVKAIITGLTQSNSGQQASFTILDPIVRDFDEAWDAAMSGATVADFDTFWDARLAGATVADFDNDPLATT